jgi:hypothetical protein
MPFTYYGANRDQGTLFHFTGTLWGTISPDLLLAMCKSIFGKSQQAVGIGIDGVVRAYATGQKTRHLDFLCNSFNINYTGLIQQGFCVCLKHN